MRGWKVFKIIGLIGILSTQITMLFTMIFSAQTKFVTTINFNTYGEAIPELVWLFISAIVAFVLFIEMVKQKGKSLKKHEPKFEKIYDRPKHRDKEDKEENGIEFIDLPD